MILFSRLILTGIIIYGLFIVWTRPVNLFLWIKNSIEDMLHISNEPTDSSSTLSPTPETISQLGARSKWASEGGDRESYSILLDWNGSVKDSNVKSLISREIDNIKDNYRNSTTNIYVENFRAICKQIQIPGGKPCSEGWEPTIGFSAKNVLEHLDKEKYSFWFERAKAAYLLRNFDTSIDSKFLNKHDVSEWLIKVMKKENENSLLVSKMALDTYSILNNYHKVDVFDFDGAIKNWENLRLKVPVLTN